MKRIHIHVGVADLENAVPFYTALFAAKPTVSKPDYAKWLLDDPRVNFAISPAKPGSGGVRHLGIQTESGAELEEVNARLAAAYETTAQPDAACCYAKSDKHWAAGPGGLTWELFHTRGEIEEFGEGRGPVASQQTEQKPQACC